MQGQAWTTGLVMLVWTQGHVPVDLDQNDTEAAEGSFVNIVVNKQDGVHIEDAGRFG